MDTKSFANPFVKPVINAAGTLTSLGGCRTRPEAVEAMARAADNFIPFENFQIRVGEYLARILRVDAAMVTAGAAPGLTLAAAACLATANPGIMPHLPAQKPVKNQIIIQCSHRNPFERAISLAGATLVQVGDAIRTRSVDLDPAFDESTAAVVFFLQAEMLASSLCLDATLEIAHAAQRIVHTSRPRTSRLAARRYLFGSYVRE